MGGGVTPEPTSTVIKDDAFVPIQYRTASSLLKSTTPPPDGLTTVFDISKDQNKSVLLWYDGEASETNPIYWYSPCDKVYIGEQPYGLFNHLRCKILDLRDFDPSKVVGTGYNIEDVKPGLFNGTIADTININNEEWDEFSNGSKHYFGLSPAGPDVCCNLNMVGEEEVGNPTVGPYRACFKCANVIYKNGTYSIPYYE